MSKLKNIWIEHYEPSNPAIRIDWDNNRHQRIEIKGDSPKHLSKAFKRAALIIDTEIKEGVV